MSWLIPTLVRIKGWPLYRCLQNAAGDPARVQRALLFNILIKNADTGFGKKYGFKEIRNETEYQKRVPIQDYQTLEPFIERSLTGEQGALTVDPPIRFNVTSGTAGNPKYIPVTADSQRLTSQLMEQWLYRSLKDHPQLLDHSCLLIASPAVEGKTSGGIPYGSATGLVYEKLPKPLQRYFAIPFLVSQIKDYNLRYYTLARFALGRRISFVGTPNPTTLVRIAEAAIFHQDLLIRSIQTGRLCDKNSAFDLKEQESVVMELEKNLRPDPIRARFLTLVAQKKGALRLGDCWPELRMIACWLGSSMGAQVHRIYDHFDRQVPVRDFGYQASEGSFSLPHQDHTPSGILALFNCYYEFVPEEDLEGDPKGSLLCHQLEVGRRYSAILTTPSGLYRYHINDIIEVNGQYENTPLITFVRKGRDIANITGEKVHINQLISTISKIKEELGLPLNQFRVIPNIEKARYDFFIEFGIAVTTDLIQKEVISGIDRILSNLNIEYKQKRASLRLNPPSVFLMRTGWEQEDRRRYVNSGKKDAQYKWKILAENPTALEEDYTQAIIESDY